MLLSSLSTSGRKGPTESNNLGETESEEVKWDVERGSEFRRSPSLLAQYILEAERGKVGERGKVLGVRGVLSQSRGKESHRTFLALWREEGQTEPPA